MKKTERKKIAFCMVCVLLMMSLWAHPFVSADMHNNGENTLADTPADTATGSASMEPGESPTVSPSANPTVMPSGTPTASPSETPTASPSGTPTASPSETPTASPGGTPTASPSETPTVVPSGSPTASPSETPTASPGGTPTASPSETPTVVPSGSPTASPGETPAASPGGTPTASPSETPAVVPSGTPTALPSETPTASPSESPSTYPSESPVPVPSQQPVTVKKTVTVTLGQSLTIGKIVSDSSVFEKMTLPQAKKYRKYFRINGKTGKITTQRNYSVKIQKNIPVKIWLRGVEEPYSVKVKIKIPKPNVKIKVKNYIYQGEQGYDFSFHYHLVKGSNLKVRLVKGGTKEINRYFDKYISGRKSKKTSHIRITGRSISKNGNHISFKIIAQLGKGKNKSQTLVIRMKKNKKGKWIRV